MTDGCYLFRVGAQGRGIAQAGLANIGPFVQFDRAKYEQLGSGLELAIVQRLAGLTGGTFQFTSTPAVGIVATITLPLAR